MLRGLIQRLRKAFRPAPPRPKPQADPRISADPWLRPLFEALGERYQLGPDGAQVLRRTGKARFNPMPVWLRAGLVQGDYEVRGDAAQAAALLDARVTGPLAALGLAPAASTVEEWAGTVLTRRYEGRCEDPRAAAAAVRYFCEESELQVNLAAE